MPFSCRSTPFSNHLFLSLSLSLVPSIRRLIRCSSNCVRERVRFYSWKVKINDAEREQEGIRWGNHDWKQMYGFTRGRIVRFYERMRQWWHFLKHDFDKWRKIVDGVTLSCRVNLLLRILKQFIVIWDFKKIIQFDWYCFIFNECKSKIKKCTLNHDLSW